MVCRVVLGGVWDGLDVVVLLGWWVLGMFLWVSWGYWCCGVIFVCVGSWGGLVGVVWFGLLWGVGWGYVLLVGCWWFGVCMGCYVGGFVLVWVVFGVFGGWCGGGVLWCWWVVGGWGVLVGLWVVGVWGGVVVGGLGVCGVVCWVVGLFMLLVVV